MNSARIKALVLVLLMGSAWVAYSEEVRLANGKKISGTVKSVTDAGLELETAKGVKTIPWSNLSAGTRYTHQPSYRDNFDSILKGLPPSARTNQLEKVP